MKHSKSKMSLSSGVYESILTSIIQGEYAVEKKLPTELQLSEKHGVSRPVIRDVLARLKEDNLVVSRRGSGSYVTTRPDNTVLNFSKISSISDIQRNYEFRKDLESGGASLAALRRTNTQLKAIIKASDAIKRAIEQGTIATFEDFQFHLAIAEASNNFYYPTVLKSLEKNIQQGMNLTRTLSLQAPVNRLLTVQAEHDEILQSITDGDPERAKQAMMDHLGNAKNRMFEGSTKAN